MAAQDIKPGAVVGRRYSIERLLGQGSVGSVYLSRDLHQAGERVVLKLLISNTPMPELMESLREEFSILSQLRHPNIVRILDFGVVEGSGIPYLVEEFVDGEDLYRATEDTSPAGIVLHLLELCTVIQYLHARGIIHRDLKPSNAMLTACDGSGRKIKILDFGLARWTKGTKHIDGAGTLAYMAPEILLGHAATPRSDLYSLGILSYQLLARRLPFEDEDRGFLIQKHLQGRVDMRPIERLNGGVGFALALRSLLAKDPEKRPSSAEEVMRLFSVASGVDYSTCAGTAGESYFSAGRYIGREAEMSFLQEHARRVKESGRGCTIFVSGESGVGKTRCMKEFRIWGLLEGWRVLEAHCQAGDEKSYAPYRQVLSRTEGFNGSGKEGSSNDEIFSFEEVPSPGTTAFDLPAQSAAGQFRDRLTREIVRRLSDRPTLLLLNDFHWADEATTAVLDYLSADVGAHPILICVSVRPGEASSGAIGRLIEQSVRQMRAKVLPMEPLGERSVVDLIISMTGEVDLGTSIGPWVHRCSGGNPFFVEEILKHLVDRRLLCRELGSWQLHEEAIGKLEVPASVAVVLEHRLGQLSGPARELANWLSVFNRAVSGELLAAVAGHSGPKMADMLRELVARQIVLVEGEEEEARYELRHSLISEVIQAGIPQKHLQRMHRKIGQTLELRLDKEGHFHELAIHFIEGRCREKAVGYALKAASICRAEFANQSALRFHEYVLNNSRGLTPEQVCEAAIEAADECCATGSPKRAIKILKKQLDHARTLDFELKSRILMQLAYSYQHLGDLEMVESTARKGLTLLRRRSSPQVGATKASFLMQLAYCGLIHSHLQLGLNLLDLALSSISSHDCILAGRILALAAAIHRVSCSLHAGVVAARRSVGILTPLKDSYVLSAAFSNLGICLTALGRFTSALEIHNRAVSISENTRSVVLMAQALGNLAECLCRSGRLKEAVLVAERARKLVGDSGNPAITYAFNATLAEIKIASCEYKDAYHILKQLEKEISQDLAVFSRGYVCYLSALFHYRVGEYETALAHLDRMSKTESRESPIYESELGEVLRAMIHGEKGLTQEAIALLKSLDQKVTRKHWPYQMCIVKLHYAEMLLKTNQAAGATALINNALRLAKGMGCLPLMAYALLLKGTMYLHIWRSRGGNANGEEGVCDDGEQFLKKGRIALEEAVETAGRAQEDEILWRGNAMLADMAHVTGDTDASVALSNKAYECLASLESRVPPEFIQSYLGVGGAKQTLSDCRRRVEDHGQSNAGSGFGELNEEHLRILLRVSNVINAILDLDDLLDSIIDHLIRAMEAERVYVFLKESETGRLKCARGKNLRGDFVRRAQTISRGILEDVFRRGMPFVSASARCDPRVSNRDSVISHQLGTIFCAPLKTKGRTLGVLYADHPAAMANVGEATINLFAAFCNLSAIAVDNALIHRRLVEEKTELEEHLQGSREDFPEIVGRSRVLRDLREHMVLVAQAPLDVLIRGESGTGKELVARAIHRTGRRSAGPFVALDCGSLSDSLVESELFGYRKGAFTGAAENRAGLLEAAHRGTLFLDEISNLSMKLQAKLLRVLQEREVRRIGETAPRKVDIQVIAATNKNLHAEIRRGKFGRDLYYRLSVMEIEVPPLRERMEDLPLLLDFFLANTAEAAGGRKKSFAHEAVERLLHYDYPGNIRELQHAVQSAYYLCPGPTIGVEHLTERLRRGAGNIPSREESDGHDIYQQIKDGEGTFENLVKRPFIERKFGTNVVRQVLHEALTESGGRYRDAFRTLKIPEGSYSAMMLFLKRNKCYLDYRPFRKPPSRAGH